MNGGEGEKERKQEGKERGERGRKGSCAQIGVFKSAYDMQLAYHIRDN